MVICLCPSWKVRSFKISIFLFFDNWSMHLQHTGIIYRPKRVSPGLERVQTTFRAMFSSRWTCKQSIVSPRCQVRQMQTQQTYEMFLSKMNIWCLWNIKLIQNCFPKWYSATLPECIPLLLFFNFEENVVMSTKNSVNFLGAACFHRNE